MSQENPQQDKRAHFQAVIDALNCRDFDALTDLVDPHCEFRSALAVAEGEVYIGIHGLRKWAESVDATWDGFFIEVAEFHDAGGDQAVAVTRNLGTAKASGIPLDQRSGAVLTWRNGKGWRNVVYSDPREAFRAAGLQD